MTARPMTMRDWQLWRPTRTVDAVAALLPEHSSLRLAVDEDGPCWLVVLDDGALDPLLGLRGLPAASDRPLPWTLGVAA